MILLENHSLTHCNTFGISAKSRLFIEITSEAELCELIESRLLVSSPHFLLGEGSNVILPPFFDGIMVKMSLLGIEIVDENEDFIFIKAKAGENWSKFADYCVDNGWSGAENLSAIPGSVGAVPIQNTGAYGVEAKDVVVQVETVEISTGKKHIFPNAECRFGYRKSVFKEMYKNKHIVTAVIFKLSKHPEIQFYNESIREEFKNLNIFNPTVKDVSRVIKKVREKKLPDPAKTGSTGSFFKNPIIKQEHYLDLIAKYPSMISFRIKGTRNYKIAAGWLIEQCGWKGKQMGNVGVYPNQALVLYNCGGCTGQEVATLASAIQQSVKEKFTIWLEPEVIFV